MADRIKQVIVVRKDLGMRKGKLAAQVAHASMKVILDRMSKSNDGTDRNWLFYLYLTEDTNTQIRDWLINQSFAKIVVSVDSESELFDVKVAADGAGIQTALIVDSGKTEFHGIPTPTTVAIGPDISEKIDKITGHLKLL